MGSGQLATDLRVIEYSGHTVLSFFSGNRYDEHAFGSRVIMGHNYRTEAQFTQSSIGVMPEEHEFNIINNGRTAVMTSYRPRHYDLSPVNESRGMGWILDSLFYEIDLQTKQVLFEWSALDHIDPSAGLIPLSAQDHGGLAPEYAWDYL